MMAALLSPFHRLLHSGSGTVSEPITVFHLFPFSSAFLVALYIYFTSLVSFEQRGLPPSYIVFHVCFPFYVKFEVLVPH